MTSLLRQGPRNVGHERLVYLRIRDGSGRFGHDHQQPGPACPDRLWDGRPVGVVGLLICECVEATAARVDRFLSRDDKECAR